MRILVIGVTGHIGLTTAIYAKNRRFKVFGTYNKTYKNKINLLNKNKIKLFKVNVKNKNVLKNIILKNKIDSCIYATASSHEIYAKKDPANAIDANSIGILNLIEIQKLYNFNLIYISTGSVFQEVRDSKNIYENKIPTPKSIYSASKRLGETLIEVFRDYKKLNLCSLRISWVYGPPIINKELNIQRGPIPKIMYDLTKKNKKNFKFKSGGNFKASFTYINDVNEALIKLVKMKKFNKAYYHLGTGKNNSLSDVFKILKKLDNKIKFKVGSGTRPWSNDSVIRGPLVSNDKKFIAKTKLDKGLKKYYFWLKKNA